MFGVCSYYTSSWLFRGQIRELQNKSLLDKSHFYNLLQNQKYRQMLVYSISHEPILVGNLLEYSTPPPQLFTACLLKLKEMWIMKWKTFPLNLQRLWPPIFLSFNFMQICSMSHHNNFFCGKILNWKYELSSFERHFVYQQMWGLCENSMQSTHMWFICMWRSSLDATVNKWWSTRVSHSYLPVNVISYKQFHLSKIENWSQELDVWSFSNVRGGFLTPWRRAMKESHDNSLPEEAGSRVNISHIIKSSDRNKCFFL